MQTLGVICVLLGLVYITKADQCKMGGDRYILANEQFDGQRRKLSKEFPPVGHYLTIYESPDDFSDCFMKVLAEIDPQYAADPTGASCYGKSYPAGCNFFKGVRLIMGTADCKIDFEVSLVSAVNIEDRMPKIKVNNELFDLVNGARYDLTCGGTTDGTYKVSNWISSINNQLFISNNDACTSSHSVKFQTRYNEIIIKEPHAVAEQAYGLCTAQS